MRVSSPDDLGRADEGGPPASDCAQGRAQDFALEGRSLVLEQAALEARRQELTVRLKQVLQAGDTLTDLLRTGIRQHYGYQSEALIEFGIQPLRAVGRPRKPKPLPPPPAPETAAPTDSSPDTTK